LGNILTLFQDSKIEIRNEEPLFEKVRNIALKYKINIKEKSIEDLVDLLIKSRDDARNKKDWETADTIRDELEKIGFEIQDTSKGSVWRKNRI